ncbi:MAG: NADH:ubiquinone reductase (Na(+)-transporting) subunit A [Proteobacteria bacterium]|nr:MAG: NADH:ubiquinone reductase (Na(+)-transporting) subunit A [Pseudomonadota bacterium]
MKISKGLDIPIAGKPEQQIYDHPKPIKIAVLGRDFHDLSPAMQVQEGDYVKLGQILFTDRKIDGINFTAPGAGKVVAINRGAKRVLNAVVIELDEQEDAVDFGTHAPEALATLDPALIRSTLQASGQWVAFRTRPYSKVPHKDAKPAAIFVTAMETRPLAADPAVVMREETYIEAFHDGLQVLARLAPKVYVCHETGADIPRAEIEGVLWQDFEGVHPAGLPGTHIHFLEPVSESRSVWSLTYQDVIAIGKLFTTGKLFVNRVIALAGPAINEPRLLRTRLGVSTDELVKGELTCELCRVISGSVLSGHHAADSSAFLGYHHLQVSVISEEQSRKFLHWLNPLLQQFSVMNIFLPSKEREMPFKMSSSQNGSPRAMVPLGNYERVMPLDILPTQLLKSLLVRDTVSAQALGALELDEEDLALCTFVCQGKYEYGLALRECLRMLERGE